MIPFLISTTQFQIIVNTLYNIFEDTTSCSLLFLCQASRIDKRVWLNKRDKVLAALEPSEYGPKGIGIFANVLVEGIYLKINLELNNSAIHWF